MRGGAMDRRIVIEQVTTVNNTFGEDVETWTTFATVWCHVKPIRGQEVFQTDQTVAVQQTQFRIRYRTGIDEKMRIVYDGDTYDIISILELGRREGLDIMATVNNPVVS